MPISKNCGLYCYAVTKISNSIEFKKYILWLLHLILQSSLSCTKALPSDNRIPIACRNPIPTSPLQTILYMDCEGFSVKSL